MAVGNRIVVTGEPKGSMREGVVAAGQTIYPGCIVQADYTQAELGGNPVVKLYDRAADGDRPSGPYFVVREDEYQGRGPLVPYTAGSIIFLYVPLPGDQLNLLISDVAGTADIVKNTRLMVDDGTGELIAVTGAPQSE